MMQPFQFLSAQRHPVPAWLNVRPVEDAFLIFSARDLT